MILPLLEALLPLLLLFTTDFLGRGIERYANGLHPEPTLAVACGLGRVRFRFTVLWGNRYFYDGVTRFSARVQLHVLL